MKRFLVVPILLLVFGAALMTLYTIRPLSHPFALWVGFLWGINTAINIKTIHNIGRDGWLR